MVILSAKGPNLAVIMIIELKNPIFRRISKIASKEEMPSYLIGGFVRDLIMNRPTKDIDIVTLGSGIKLAKLVAEDLGKTKIQIFKNFGTAMVMSKDMQLEFVGARKESYRRNSRKLFN